MLSIVVAIVESVSSTWVMLSGVAVGWNVVVRWPELDQMVVVEWALATARWFPSDVNEEVKLRDGEGSSLLLMRDTVLGCESTRGTSPNIDL